MLVEPAVFRASVANPRQQKRVHLSTRIAPSSNAYVDTSVREYQAILEQLYGRLATTAWPEVQHPVIQHRMILHQ